MTSKKFALIHMGVDVVYGLEFVAAEINKLGHEFKWFDGDLENVANSIAEWIPDFICFSPLTTFFPSAIQLSRQVKKHIPDVHSVFGGHHVSAVPSVIGMEEVDIVVTGPVFGIIDNIVNHKEGKIIKGQPGDPELIMPLSSKYFNQIPRIGRHRKIIMSHFGCLYNCSFCSTSRVKRAYGAQTYKKYWLTRRPIKNLIEEAKVFLDFPTTEVNLADDDILYGADIENWLTEFTLAWKREINLPIYGFIAPNTVVRASNKSLETLASLVDTVAMGVQAARYESLKLFNRQHQDEDKVIKAFERLKEFGIPTKLELIIGLPVDDPVDDAIETIKFAQRVGAGTFAVAFPLMLYPGSALESYCRQNNTLINEKCSFNWYSGKGSIRFDDDTAQKIQNLSKLSTFFIKYNVEERWIRSLIESPLSNDTLKMISENNYLESLVFRQGEKVLHHIDEALAQQCFDVEIYNR